ncbi:hypothetical protein ACFYO2_06015 [Streptomyces sp. NPDC006602]|uniref:hypothetical protein n=1 Tax=Streptomyces sp. NPDC006602 TaxID=3364751 RepID=UPI0036A8A08D
MLGDTTEGALLVAAKAGLDLGVEEEAAAPQVTELPDPVVVTGARLDAMDEESLDALLDQKSELLLCRVSPEHKMRVVTAFQRRGETSARTILAPSLPHSAVTPEGFPGNRDHQPVGPLARRTPSSRRSAGVHDSMEEAAAAPISESQPVSPAVSTVPLPKPTCCVRQAGVCCPACHACRASSYPPTLRDFGTSRETWWCGSATSGRSRIYAGYSLIQSGSM